MAEYVAAIDQGTTSSRLILFDRDGRARCVERREHEQITPRPGWVEHDPKEVWRRTREAIGGALASSGTEAGDVVAIGIANQRETTVVWDRETGEPVYNAIVWQDTRTADIVRELAGEEGPDRLRREVGLPLSTYFSGPKIRWILDHVEGARERAENGELAFGTMDSWVLWNLTGGPRGGVHATDVTNASRTMLMSLETLDWHGPSLDLMGIPRAMLPAIRSSAEVYGEARGTALGGRPVAALLGDQQAAMVGQTCFAPGDAKNTYGTGSFLLVNTGAEIVRSEVLLTTVGAKLGPDAPAAYMLEGSIAVTGAAVQWLRDRIGLIEDAAEIEALARTVDDNGGVYFVPAFSGLFAPYWRDDARGAILGLTAYATKGHLARATLEATAWQSREVVDAVAGAGVPLRELKVDGGMTGDDLLMQLQADVLGVPVIRPVVTETTALGAAFAAGLATAFWSGADELRERWEEEGRWEPAMDPTERERRYRQWKKAVERTFDWVD